MGLELLPDLLEQVSGNYLVIAGLIFDIGGVIMIGWALAAVSTTRLGDQSGTYFNYSRAIARGLAEQRIDTWFGVSLLVVGFGLQAAGAAVTEAPALLIYIVCALFALTLLAYWPVRQRNITRTLDRIEQRFLEEDRP